VAASAPGAVGPGLGRRRAFGSPDREHGRDIEVADTGRDTPRRDRATGHTARDPATSHTARDRATSHTAHDPATSHTARDPATSHTARDDHSPRRARHRAIPHAMIISYPNMPGICPEMPGICSVILRYASLCSISPAARTVRHGVSGASGPTVRLSRAADGATMKRHGTTNE